MERPTYKSKNNKAIKERLAGILNTKAYNGYDASRDSVYSDYTRGNLERSKIAAQRTVDYADKNLGKNTYSQAAAQGTRIRFDANNNSIVPALADVDYNKQRSARENQYTGINALQTNESYAYKKYRDKVGDWEFERNAKLKEAYLKKKQAEAAAAAAAKQEKADAAAAAKAAKEAAKAAKGRKGGSGGSTTAPEPAPAQSSEYYFRNRPPQTYEDEARYKANGIQTNNYQQSGMNYNDSRFQAPQQTLSDQLYDRYYSQKNHETAKTRGQAESNIQNNSDELKNVEKDIARTESNLDKAEKTGDKAKVNYNKALLEAQTRRKDTLDALLSSDEKYLDDKKTIPERKEFIEDSEKRVEQLNKLIQKQEDKLIENNSTGFTGAGYYDRLNKAKSAREDFINERENLVNQIKEQKAKIAEQKYSRLTPDQMDSHIKAAKGEEKEILQMVKFNKQEDVNKDIIANDPEVSRILSSVIDYNTSNEKGYGQSGRSMAVEGSRFAASKELESRGYDAKSLMDTYSRMENERLYDEAVSRSTEFAKAHPVLASEASVAQNMVKGAGAINMLKDNIYNAIPGTEYKPVDYKDPSFAIGAQSEAIRGEVSNELTENYGKPAAFAYNVGMSMVDSLSQRALGGASLYILGAGAGADAARAAAERGLDDKHVAATAVAAGAAEYFFEKFELDNLEAFKQEATTGFKSYMKNVGKQAVNEGFGEGMTDIANAFTDWMINKDNSEFNTSIRSYMDQGLSYSDAKSAAAKDWANEFAQDILAGALSGGISAGATMTATNIRNKAADAYNTNKAGREAQSNIDQVIEKGLDSSNAKTVEQANQIMEKWGNDQTVSNKELGKLVNSNNLDETTSVIKNALSDTQNGAENAQILSKAVSGEVLSASEAKSVISSPEATQALSAMSGIELNENSTVREVVEAATTIKGIQLQSNDNNPTGKVVGSTISTQNGEGTLKNVMIRNGKAFLEIQKADGSKDLVSATKYNSAGDQNIDTIVGNLNKYGENGAKGYVQGYDGTMSADDYTKAYNAYYQAGMVGLKKSDIQSVYGNMLPESVKEMAYQNGLNDSSENIATKSSNVVKSDRTDHKFVKNENTKLSDNEQKMLDSFAKAAGVDIVMSDEDSINGLYSKGTIYISNNADNPAMVVLLHEYAHHLEDTAPEAYSKYRDEVIKFLKTADSERYNEIAEGLRKLYEQNNVPLSEEALMNEIAANATESFLSDMDSWQEALSEDKTFLQKLVDFVNDFVEYLKNEFSGKKISDEGAQMIAENEEVLKRLQKLYSQAMNEANGKKAERGAARYSIKENKNFGSYVEVELYENEFDEAEKHGIKEMQKIASKIIQNKFQGKTIHANDDEFTVNREARLEFTGKRDRNGMHPYKLRTAGEIDNIIKASTVMATDVPNEKPDQHPSVDSFDYYYTVFKLSNIEDYFTGVVVVENMNDGRKIIYDVTDIEMTKEDRIKPRLRNILNSSARYGRNPLSDNVSQNDESDKKFSLKKDSQGRNLPEGVQKYFKDSKILDKDGNLRVMYHGSPETFTVFDPKKAKRSGTFGSGFYFSSSDSHAGQYGNTQEVYLNSVNPLSSINPTNNITKDQLRNFIQALADNEDDYGLDNYGYGATVDSVLDSTWGGDDFQMMMDINLTAVGNMVEAIKLFNEVNRTNIDGIDTPIETVVWESNQVKNVDNTAPTEDEDIRYSLKKFEPTQEEKDSFVDGGDGLLRIVDARHISSDMWMQLTKKFQKLGYGFEDWKATKKYYNDMLSDENVKSMLLNKDMSNAVKNILGIDETEETSKIDTKKAAETAKKAEKTFGTTNRFDLAGYLDVNGKLLDFSEGQGYRVQDHREISEVLDLPEDAGYSDGLIEFMNQGNIRLQNYGIDISVKPNDNQRDMLYKFFDSLDGEVTVDFSSEEGNSLWSADYKEGTSARRILNDIDKFFDTDERPEGTADGNTYYSLKKTEDAGVDYDENESNIMSMADLIKQALDSSARFEPTEGQLNALAKKYVEKTNSDYDENAFKRYMKEIAETLNKNQQNSAVNAIKALQGIAMRVLETSKELDYSMKNEYKDVVDYLRTTKIKVGDKQKQEAAYRFDSYNNFRRKYFGKIKFGNEGIGADTAIKELNDMFPGLLPDDVTEGDAPFVLADMLDVINTPDARKMVDLVGYGNLEQQSYQMAMDMMSKLMTTMNPTEANALKQVNQLRAQYNEQLEAEKKRIKDEFFGKLKDVSTSINVDALNPDTAMKMLEAYANNTQHTREVAEQKRENATRSKYKKDARKISDSLYKALTNPTQSRYIPTELVNGVIDFCKEINFDTGWRRPDGQPTKAYEKLQSMRKSYEHLKNENTDTGMVTLMAQLDDGTLKDTGAAYDAAIPQLIDQVSEMFKGDRAINDLSTGELEDLVKGLSYIDESVRNATRLKGKYKAKESYVMAESIINDIKNSSGSKNLILNKYTNSVLSPLRFFRRLTGYNENSEMMKLYNDLQQGEVNEHRYQQDAEDILKPVMEGKENEKMLSKITGKKAEWEDIGLKDDKGNPVLITPAMKMSLYMHSLNKSNAEHASGGGVKIPDMKLYKAGKITEAYNHGTIVKTPENFIKNMESRLSDYEKAYVKQAKIFFNEYSKKLVNKTSMQMLGYEKANVKNYFPIRTDSNFNRGAFDSIAFDFSIANSGFLKNRQQGSKNPIILEDITSVLQRQINSVAKYAALAVPIDNFSKVYNVSLFDYENSVKNQISKTWDQSSMDYISKLMGDLNGVRDSDKSLVSDALAGFRGLMAQGVLTGNISVTLKQAASYPTAAATLGWKPLMKAWAKGGKKNLPSIYPGFNYFNGPKADIINKYTPEWRYRGGGKSTIELGDLASQNSWLTKAGKTPVIGRFINSIQDVDIMTTGRLWDAAEYYVQDHFNYKKGSDSYYRKTAEIFNETIHNTQPNYAILNRPEILRSKSEAAKALTMFMTQRLQNGNILMDSTLNLRAKSKAYKANNSEANLKALKDARVEFANSVTSQLVAAVVIGGMTLIAKTAYHNMDRYRDDDKEITADSIMSRFTQDVMSSLAGSFLFGSEIYDFVSSKITGDNYYGISDNLFGNLEDAIDGFSKFVDVCKKEFMKEDTEEYDADSIIAATTKFASTLCQAVGIPLSNVTNIAQGIMLHYEDIKNGEAGSFESGLVRKNSENAQKLYDAFMNGDEKDITKFYNAMVQAGKTEKQIESALKTALVENEAVAAGAQARYDKDYSVYADEVNKLVDLGFERDTVVKAIDKYIEDNFEEKEEKEDPTKESYTYNDIMEQISNGRLYENEDMFQAVTNNDMALADTIKQDAIDSAMKKDGLSYEEAEEKVSRSLKNGVKSEYIDQMYDLYSNGKTSEGDTLKETLKAIYGYEDKNFKSWLPEGKDDEFVDAFMRGDYSKSKDLAKIMRNYGYNDDAFDSLAKKELKSRYIEANEANNNTEMLNIQKKAEDIGVKYSTILGWVGKKTHTDSTTNIENAIKTFSGGSGDYNSYLNKAIEARDAEIKRIMDSTGKDEWDARKDYKSELSGYFKKIYKDLSVEDRNRLQNILNTYFWYGKSRKKNTPYKYSNWLNASDDTEDEEESTKIKFY